MRLKRRINIDNIRQIIEQYPESDDILSRRVKENLETNESIDINNFKCPMSFNFFINPMIIEDSGITFEKETLDIWLRENNTCPLTKIPIKTIVKNSMIYDLMEELVNYDIEERLKRIDELSLTKLIETEDERLLSIYFDKIIRMINTIGNDDLFYKLMRKIPEVVNKNIHEYSVRRFIDQDNFPKLMNIDYRSTLMSISSIFQYYSFEFEKWIRNKSDEKKKEILRYLNSINRTIYETNSNIRLLMTKYRIRIIDFENYSWFFHLKLEDIVKIVEIELSIDNISCFLKGKEDKLSGHLQMYETIGCLQHGIYKDKTKLEIVKFIFFEKIIKNN